MTMFEIVRALIGQMDPARGTVEKGYAEMALERGERPDHGRRRGTERIRSCRKIAGLHDSNEDLHRQELVHAREYYFNLWSSPFRFVAFISSDESDGRAGPR